MAVYWARERRIGEGTYGTVWLQLEKVGDVRAVKILRGVRAMKILRGIEEIQGLGPRNLQAFYGGEYPFLARAPIGGLNIGLQDYVGYFGRVREGSAKEITSQLLEGLAVLHEGDICHWDLKPKNILVASVSPIQVKLSDFGVSKDLNLRAPALEPFHMVSGGSRGLRSANVAQPPTTSVYAKALDICCLGSTIYEILTLERPFMEFYLDAASWHSLGYNRNLEMQEADMMRLADFVRGKFPFRTEAPEEALVSGAGIDFIKSLFMINPSSLMSATDALNNNWLTEFDIQLYKLNTTFETNHVVHTSIVKEIRKVWEHQEVIGGEGFGEAWTEIPEIEEKITEVGEIGSVVHRKAWPRRLGTKERITEVRKVWKEVGMIGSGGYGSVWLEKEVGTGKQRAVKRVSRDLYKSHKVDFSRELRALIMVRDCPDVFVQFFGWYENDQHIFLAMEYIEQGDLGQYLKVHMQQTEADTKEITRQLLGGLRFLHEREICHRDLKPQNILIVSTSPIVIKLSDFGISKCTMQQTNLRTPMLGTLGYMAPELLGVLPRVLHPGIGKNYTNAVDIWALGCLICEILTLETPFLCEPQTLTSGAIPYTGQPSPDVTLLSEFCHGTIELPVGFLKKFGVSDEGVEFIKQMLAANPKCRISAEDAMKSRWMSGLPVSQYGVVRDQFLKLGIHLSLSDIEELILKCKRCREVENPEVAPPMIEDPNSLLHAAALEGYISIVEIMSCLIPTGKGSIDSRIDGWTPLQTAAKRGHLDVVKLLLEKNAKVNANPYKERGRTALQAAAQGGHLEVVKLLLEMEANVNAKPSYIAGRQALQAAADSGSLEVANLLLEMGTEVNSPPCKIQGRTALQAAAGKGNLEFVRLLIENGAKVDAGPCDIKGRTALQAAAENGHLTVAKFLLTKGAEVNAEPCEMEGRTALQAAAENGHLDMVQLLLEMGADVNAEPCPEEGATALSAAVKGRYLEVEEVLRAAGAELCDD